VTGFEDKLREMIREVVQEEIAKAGGAAGGELVTVAKYAERCSISQSTVRAAIADGRLEAVKIGRAVRIPANATIARPARAVDDTEAKALELLGVRSARGAR
jgi:excisionase family DNA binding protein